MFGWFSFGTPELLAAVLASGLGTFVMLALYIQFFKRQEKPNSTSSKVNMNYIIGAITGVIAVITLISILKDI